MNIFQQMNILPKAGVLLRHQSGHESRLVRDWGRVPEHWDAVREDRATRLIAVDEARIQGTSMHKMSAEFVWPEEG